MCVRAMDEPVGRLPRLRSADDTSVCCAVQKPFGHFIRAVLLMPLYVPLFAPKASSSGTASDIYTNVLKARTFVNA